MNAMYAERLRIAWLLIWRGALLNGALGGGAGFAIGFTFALIRPHIGVTIEGMAMVSAIAAIVAGFLLAFFLGVPITVNMMLRKRTEVSACK